MGDVVWFYFLKYEKYGKKLCRLWIGFYFIVKRVNDVIYKIRKILKYKLKIVYYNLFKLYKGDNLFCFF